ncbi:PREDICTED: sialidase-1-like [Branchiostoma belcheri]|uniref:Sialidase-1 n=1 Tax=Branchiostoma belcheri TaxID=7741 RepID=A0A6P4ZQ37_BRABE|nr:PREDICTED: sialidase-1-like [Branchiostoma belcheri]
MADGRTTFVAVLSVFLLGLCQHGSSQQPSPVSPLIVEEQLLYVGGTWGEVHTYRIPIMVGTPKGNLITVVEARQFSSGDSGPKFMAIRRSEDKGFTWSEMDYVLNDGSFQDGMNLGTILVDEITNEIFIFYTHCAHYYECKVSTTYLVSSKDEGKSWSHPRNLSEEIGTMMFAPGPGYGIQKRYAPNKGRLLTCGHGTLAGDGVFCLISDDHGAHWRYSGVMKSIPYKQSKKRGDFDPDENQPVELPDGSIIVNARNQYLYHCHCRIIMRSYDGGETFPLEHLYFDETLIDPAVAAGVFYHNGVMYFSNTASEVHRENMMLRWSYDNGTTWPGALPIWDKPAAYSTLMMLPTNDMDDQQHLYLLYEKGVKSSAESISLVKISLYGNL